MEIREFTGARKLERSYLQRELLWLVMQIYEDFESLVTNPYKIIGGGGIASARAYNQIRYPTYFYQVQTAIFSASCLAKASVPPARMIWR